MTMIHTVDILSPTTGIKTVQPYAAYKVCTENLIICGSTIKSFSPSISSSGKLNMVIWIYCGSLEISCFVCVCFCTYACVYVCVFMFVWVRTCVLLCSYVCVYVCACPNSGLKKMNDWKDEMENGIC